MRDGNGILFFSFFRKRKDTMDSPALGACQNMDKKVLFMNNSSEMEELFV
jgi:hypothetical protein